MAPRTALHGDRFVDVDRAADLEDGAALRELDAAVLCMERRSPDPALLEADSHLFRARGRARESVSPVGAYRH